MHAMENTDPATEVEETRHYPGLSLIRAPKANHKSIEQIGKPIVQWFKNHGARPEIYNLSTSEFPEGVERIAKTLFMKEFGDLISEGSNLIMGGFSRLRL